MNSIFIFKNDVHVHVSSTKSVHFISIGSENEDSDQEREWEEQQIKKGVSLGSEVRVKWHTIRICCFNVLATQTSICTVDGSLKILLKRANLHVQQDKRKNAV